MTNVIIDPLVKETIESILHAEGEPYFKERGGTLFGKFDGEKIAILDLNEDFIAARSVGSIIFSYEHFIESLEREKWFQRNLNTEGNSTYVGRIGTWHTHPPGYGAKYSHTDQTKLFLEWMVLSTDDPTDALIPKIHLVCCKTEKHLIKSYMLNIGASFEKTIEDDYEIANQTNSKIALIVKENNGLSEVPYFPWNFEENIKKETLMGLIIRFNYLKVPQNLEDVILENFYLKIPHELRSQEMMYKRELSDRTIEFFLVNRIPPVDVAWQHEEIEWNIA